jgi:hypothetical protein
MYQAGLILGALAAAVIARLNWKAGRGDARGATRVALFVMIASMATWLLQSHHVLAAAEEVLVFEALAEAAATGAIFWIVYLALEPWVRRYWPQSLISWSRVLAGRWRDPMVGRDILFGMLMGLAYCVIVYGALSVEPVVIGDFGATNLMGLRWILLDFTANAEATIANSLQFFMLLFLLRVLLRKQWLAAVAFVAIWTGYRFLTWGATWWFVAALAIILYSMFVITLLRFGFLAVAIALLVFDTTLDTLGTTDLTAWYAQSSVAIVIALPALALYGFRLSLGGRPLLTSAAFEK